MSGNCCNGNGNGGNSRRGQVLPFLMGMGVALLGVNAVMMFSGLGPQVAGAQVRSVPQTNYVESAVPPAANQPPTPTSTVEMLQRVVAALNETNARLAGIEGRMNGEYPVRVVNFPAQNGK